MREPVFNETMQLGIVAAMLSASVADYDVADVRPLCSGEARHEPPHGSCHDR